MPGIVIEAGALRVRLDRDENGDVRVALLSTGPPPLPPSVPPPPGVVVGAAAPPIASGMPPEMADLAVEGCNALGGLVQEWAVNFGVLDPDAPRPDRVSLLRRVCAQSGPQITAYAQWCGGLPAAVLSVIQKQHDDEDSYAITLRAARIAENMIQIASAVYPPIAATLRYDRRLYAQVQEAEARERAAKAAARTAAAALGEPHG